MNKTLFFIGIGLSLLISMPATAKVVISQIKISGINATDEYVELYNTSSTPADTTGWSLKKRTAGGTESYLVNTFTDQLLQPFGYLLIAHKNYSGTTTPANMFYTGSDSLAINNSLLLYSAEKALLDMVSWGTASTTDGLSAPNPSNTTVLSRLPNDETGNGTDSNDNSLDFIETTNLPHINQPIIPSLEEILTTSTAANEPPTAVVLNEIMPNPAEGPEWIELYNTGDLPVNLVDSALCDGRTGSCTIAELAGTIEPHGYIVVYLKSNYLNNDGDTVKLLYVSSTIDSIAYTSLDKNQTLARTLDESGEWSKTTNPTPGTANTITTPPPTNTGSSGSGGTTPSETIKVSKQKPDIAEEQKTSTIVFKITTPTYGQTGQVSTFAINNVADPRGGIVFSTWNFGDGTLLDGNTVQHTFTSSGSKIISLSATSTRGTTSTKQFSFTVYEPPTTTAVRIEEVYAYPRSDEDSFIELYNTTSGTIDISNWQLTTSDDKKFTLPNNTIIPAYSYSVFSKIATGLTLEHGTESISLWSEKHTLQNHADIATSTKGKSFSFNVNDWIQTEPSPGTPPIAHEVLGEKITMNTFFTKATKQKSTQLTGRDTNIADVRKLNKNSTVSAVGQVTVTPEQLSKHYFYIEDASGGIQIYSTLPLPKLTVNDVVRVQGKMSSANGVIRITVSKTGSITKIKTTESAQPATTQIDDISVGKLYTVSGEITEVASNHLYLDTGEMEVRVRLSTWMKPNLHAGDQASVTGIVEMSGTDFILIPRNQNDIETVVANPATIKKKSFSLFNWFK